MLSCLCRLLPVPPVQPEPEEDRREEEDTHGHVSIEHEVRVGAAEGCAHVDNAMQPAVWAAVAVIGDMFNAN